MGGWILRMASPRWRCVISRRRNDCDLEEDLNIPAFAGMM